MPLGYERLNARHKSPNEKIVFIKPLEGPDKATSQNFLERIAAICAPVMKANYVSVVSLEEYEPNREFWGRNFNAGESIQLVLKSPSSGNWLPFRFVQMVMMHELAHCKQMNHSRAFWTVRNQYVTELRALWASNYTGDGFWGKGQALYDGQYTQDNMPMSEQLPQHLCGGVYQSRRGKRKRRNATENQILTYAERKQRRIEKKFGTNGIELGKDEGARSKLEQGKTVAAKPRVAGSVRGRELRAAAALARFEQAKEAIVKDEETESDDDDDDEDNQLVKEEALDSRGNRILDFQGHGMVKICAEENLLDDLDAQHELRDFAPFGLNGSAFLEVANETKVQMKKESQIYIKEEDISTASESEKDSNNADKQCNSASIEPVLSVSRQKPSADLSPACNSTTKALRTTQLSGKTAVPLSNLSNNINFAIAPDAMKPSQGNGKTSYVSCKICSLDNVPNALICAACAHVLFPEKLHHHWCCQSDVCRESQYINAADVGRCGVCGEVKPIV